MDFVLGVWFDFNIWVSNWIFKLLRCYKSYICDRDLKGVVLLLVVSYWKKVIRNRVIFDSNS